MRSDAVLHGADWFGALWHCADHADCDRCPHGSMCDPVHAPRLRAVADPLPVSPRCVIRRDGKPVAIVDDENAAFAWLLRAQGQSVDHATRFEGWSYGIAEPWPATAADTADPAGDGRYENAEHMARMARQQLVGDESHRAGDCRRYGQAARMSCGTCALLGYQPRDLAARDGWDVRFDGPNYAAWQRVYVQGSRPIPERWHAAFDAARTDDNVSMAAALERDIATFGVRFD